MDLEVRCLTLVVLAVVDPSLIGYEHPVTAFGDFWVQLPSTLPCF